MIPIAVMASFLFNPDLLSSRQTSGPPSAYAQCQHIHHRLSGL